MDEQFSNIEARLAEIEAKLDATHKPCNFVGQTSAVDEGPC